MSKLSFSYTRLIVAFVVSAFIFTSCKKSGGNEVPDPPVNTDPIRVEKTIYTNLINGELRIDTLTFTYDAVGRVTSRTNVKGSYREEYTFTGDKLTSLKIVGDNGTGEGLNEAYYSSDGDTIILDLKANGPVDTIRLTYIFKDNLQTDFWTYLHTSDPGCNCSVEHQLQKEKWYFNSQDNFVNLTTQTLLDPNEVHRLTITSWDDKKNPKHGQPKINALTLSLNVPLESYSANNPRTYTDLQGSHEIEMTYNSEGYPLTFKLKENDYISTQLVYKR
jgi:hypothetical protein